MMNKKALAALLAVYSANAAASGAMAQGSHSHPVETPVVCNPKGNFPSDGAQTRFIRTGGLHGQVVLSLTKPDIQCSEIGGGDEVGIGARIDCNGLPANNFTCVVSNFSQGEPFFSIAVNGPNGAQVIQNVPFSTQSLGTGGFLVRSNLAPLGLPKGTKFQSIYVWDTTDPVDTTVRNFTVDGIPAALNLRTPFVLDCTGVNPPDCGSSSS